VDKRFARKLEIKFVDLDHLINCCEIFFKRKGKKSKFDPLAVSFYCIGQLLAKKIF